MAADCPPLCIDTKVCSIGNGPSSITLSYLLSGNIPYYSGDPHPDESLHHRLATVNTSILQSDLQFLSSGLEGRSSNPVSLLYDALQHPGADVGSGLPSLLAWRYEAPMVVSHIVVGCHLPGGAWQSMCSTSMSLSLNEWMEMPNMRFVDWLHNRGISPVKPGRVSLSQISQYYTDYVTKMGLEDSFLSGVEITSVIRTCSNNKSNHNIQRGVKNLNNNDGDTNFIVSGYMIDSKREVKITCKYLVLATGSTGTINYLDINGEDLPSVSHTLSKFVDTICQPEYPTANPVMIVGSGLSAADAVILCQERDLPVVHVFREDENSPKMIFRKLPKSIYPEYHQVYQRMKNLSYRNGYRENYKSYPKCKLVNIRRDGWCKVVGPAAGSMCGTAEVAYKMRVSHVGVFIGAQPNIEYYPNHRELLEHSECDIDSKNNVIRIDPYTYECVSGPNVFALGPLVGDNFVRFLQGGALAVSRRVHELNGTLL